MKSEKIALHDTHQFSPLFLDYLSGKENLKPFYNLPPKPHSFKGQIEQKRYSQELRKNLHKVITEQYKGISLSTAVQQNIELLEKENTYTITTGHQLNIFTGPLYFIYKIVTVINTCRELKKLYPEYNFVPVYWMASEDHDFEEISHFNLFGKEYKWEASQKGAVGHFSTEGISDILKDLPEPVPVFEEAYTKNSTLSAAVRQYVHALFSKWGLISVDADNAVLKGSFHDFVKADLFENLPNKLVENSSSRLQEAGYKAQVFPREINFFYMKPGLRERIVREGKSFQVLNSDITFTEEALLEELQNHPERFSPNVIMRPLYQEWVLPNLAYIGGPAEVAYWLQLKGVFDHFKVLFPILMPRNFALIISKANQSKLEKTGLQSTQLFRNTHELKQQLLEENAEHIINLSDESQQLNQLFEQIKEKAAAVDKSLEGFVGAEASKLVKSLENIEKRIKKAEERKHETHLNQLDNLKEKLFPGQSLQERKDNFLNFYINDPSFISKLVEQFDPFNYQFNILTYNE